MTPVSISDFIYSALCANENLRKAVGDCIYQVVVLGTGGFPYVIFRTQLEQVEYDKDHQVLTDMHSIEVQCVSQVSMKEADHVAACVREALEDFTAMTDEYQIDRIDIDNTEVGYDLTKEAFANTIRLTAYCQPI